MATLTPYKVSKEILHLHADEVFARWVGKGWGTEILLGITDPKIEVVVQGNVPQHDHAYWVAQETVVWGGGGDFSDEHRNGSTARLKDSSATKLTLEALGMDDPHLTALGNEINYYDGQIRCPQDHFASMLKAAKGEADRKVRAALVKDKDKLAKQLHARILVWSQGVLDKVYDAMEKDLKPIRGESFEKYMDKIVAERVKSGQYADADALQGLREIVLAHAAKSDLFLGLKNIFQAMWRTTKGSNLERKNMKEYILQIVDILYGYQAHWHEFIRELASEKGADVVQFDVDVVGEQESAVTAVMYRTDSLVAHTYFRNRGAMITVIQNHLGQVSIQGNRVLAEKVPGLLKDMVTLFEELGAMNRYGDMAPIERQTVSWSVLKCRGDCPVDRYWHLDIDDDGRLGIYNGTPNHDATPETNNAPENIQCNVMHAGNRYYVKMWKRNNHVPRDMSRMYKGKPLAALGPVLNSAQPLRPRPKRSRKTKADAATQT